MSKAAKRWEKTCLSALAPAIWDFLQSSTFPSASCLQIPYICGGQHPRITGQYCNESTEKQKEMGRQDEKRHTPISPLGSVKSSQTVPTQDPALLSLHSLPPLLVVKNKDEYPHSRFRLGLTAASFSPHLLAFLTQETLCYLLLLTSSLRSRTRARLLTLEP